MSQLDQPAVADSNPNGNTAAEIQQPVSPVPVGLRRTAPRARVRADVVTRGPLVFGGLLEHEGWVLAPITTLDRVHFRVDRELPLARFRAELPAGVTVSYDEGDGLYRVDGSPGQALLLAELVKSWCAVEGRRTIGLRPEPDVRRRQPRDLPPAFLEDLCRHYGPISLKRLQRNMSTIRLHLPDNDDIGQQVYEWVLKAVGTYDETKGVPFGAFLATQLTKWVHDLGRSAYGRTATDTENKQQKAVAAFISEHQRRPNERELADWTGQSVDALRRNAQTIATLAGLRNLQSLDAAPEVTEGLVPDRAEASDDILGEAEQTLLSHALTAACASDPTVRKDQRASLPNVLGWVTWYETTWTGKTKTQLAAELTTSVRNMNVHADRVQVKMRERLDELAG